MPKLSDRVGTFTDSVIRRMTRICNEYGALNLSQGFPDFPPPKPMTDALARIANEGPHQYSITFGAPNFRRALAEKHGRSINRDIDPEKEVLVTCGGTEAMMAAMMCVCNPGDEVIVFSPFYENYSADAILSGAQPIYVSLNPPDFKFDPEVLENAFRRHPKAIIICNPSNPCGKVFTRDELMFICTLAQKYDAFVITDEVYQHIVFDPHEHTVAAGLPGMYDRVITCSSLSKTYSITGWRLGYLIGPADVIECAKKVHDFLTIGAPSPLQEAAVVGLQFGQDYYDGLKELYTKKRALFLKGLDDLGIDHTTPEGTYFVMMDISKYLKQDRFKGFDDYSFSEWMIKNIGVAPVPGSSFFRENISNYVRVHFARSQETLEYALERLALLNK